VKAGSHKRAKSTECLWLFADNWSTWIIRLIKRKYDKPLQGMEGPRHIESW